MGIAATEGQAAAERRGGRLVSSLPQLGLRSPISEPVLRTQLPAGRAFGDNTREPGFVQPPEAVDRRSEPRSVRTTAQPRLSGTQRGPRSGPAAALSAATDASALFFFLTEIRWGCMKW